jgi:O-methyltransferase involved in polyketide biosynthesis
MNVERTALGPTMIVAIDQYESVPLVHDRWAVQILPRSWHICCDWADSPGCGGR